MKSEKLVKAEKLVASATLELLVAEGEAGGPLYHGVSRVVYCQQRQAHWAGREKIEREDEAKRAARRGKKILALRAKLSA